MKFPGDDPALGTFVVDARGDYVCQHGTAMDVHCCNCHSGFLFDLESCVCDFGDDDDGAEAEAA
jgi:hypothetical protein